MAADDAIGAALVRRCGNDFLETRNELDRVFHLLLEMAGERPIGQSALAADPVQHAIELEEKRVCTVAEEGEPLGVEHDPVELIAVKDEKLASVGRLMD